jgi:hypothetical protein
MLLKYFQPHIILCSVVRVEGTEGQGFRLIYLEAHLKLNSYNFSSTKHSLITFLFILWLLVAKTTFKQAQTSAPQTLILF